MRDRLRQEDGVALLLALAFSLVLSTLVFALVQYTTSNQNSARTSQADTRALGYAEAALDAAYARINYANTQIAISSGLSPSKPSLLGCGTGVNGASDCTTSTPARMCVAFESACPTGTYTATAGTGAVYGFYTGTSPAAGAKFAGIDQTASMWILVASGSVRNAGGKLDTKTIRATVTISAANSGAVASVWNHVFMTAPYVAGQCQANFAGNNMTITVPLYVIGNLCLSGQGVVVKEVAGGQPIDLQVGGALSLAGSGASVGDYGTTPQIPITSGVVVGGCTNGAITTATGSCTNGSYRYKVTNPSTFVAQSDPEETAADIANDYATFDPGPKHPCTGGWNPFDSNLAASGEPNADNTTFELAPSGSDYTCRTANGTLSWNHSTHALTINGSIFFDGNLTISSNLTYTGTAVIEVAGTITFYGNGTTVCAVNTGCVFTNWQGASGHNDMLTLATVKTNANPAIQFTNNAQTFEGSLWTQPSSSMNFLKNGVDIQGPMALGAFDASFNNATIEPLPVIKNMPVGAPVPPNVSASISPLHVYG